MNPQIVAVVVAYDGFQSKTALDIMSTVSSGIISGFVLQEGSLVVPARNSATLKATQQFPDFTHILFIDSDVVGVTPNLVQRMLLRGVDIVSPLTNRRQPPFQPHVRHPEDVQKVKEQLDRPIHERGMIEVGGASLGCCLVSRAVMEHTAEIREVEKPDGKKDVLVNWFCSERTPRDTIFAEAAELTDRLIAKYSKDYSIKTKEVIKECVKEALTLGIHSRTGGELVGEDYHFFNAARMQGFKVFVDMQLHVGHIGNFIYTIDDWEACGRSMEPKDDMLRTPNLTAWETEEKKYIEVPNGGNFKI